MLFESSLSALSKRSQNVLATCSLKVFPRSVPSKCSLEVLLSKVLLSKVLLSKVLLSKVLLSKVLLSKVFSQKCSLKSVVVVVAVVAVVAGVAVVVVVVVVQQCVHGKSLSINHDIATNSGGRTPGSQTPGVPATPEPSMTKNSSSSRAHLALNVRMDGARKMAKKKATKGNVA